MDSRKKITVVSMILLFCSLLTIQALSLPEKELSRKEWLVGEQQQQHDFERNEVVSSHYYGGQKDENLTLRLEFIGFDQNYLNETALRDSLYSSFDWGTSLPHSRFLFNFEFAYTPENDQLALENYIRSIADNGTNTGYKLNTTLLQEDLASGERSDIFIPIDGMSIDAKLVEDYLYQNLYETPATDKPGYTLYLMNFSHFDTADHSLEHWYDVTGVSFDSNQTIDWWYSGYRNLSKRAAMGWGGNHRFCYLDLSARSWFIDYVTTAWGALSPGYASYYDYPDLDNLTQTFDLETTEGQEKLTEYLADWINSYSGNLFAGPVNNPPVSESVSLQVKVFNNLTANGYPEEDLKWCISKTRIFNQLTQDIPWVNWEINIEWVELEDYPLIFNTIQSNVQEDQDGKYIEVSQGLFSILQTQLNEHFNMSAADTVLPAYYFLTDEIGFRWMGVSFAGLGGMGWEILLGTQNSLFEYGNVSKPLRGMSSVMIHELGHSLGLPHPHSGAFAWGSAFVADVMSYFAVEEGFSTFYQDAIGRAHSDAYFLNSQSEFAQAMQFYEDAGEPPELQGTIDEINSSLEAVPEYYQQMDYNASVHTARETYELILYMQDYLQNPPTTTPTTPGTTSTTSTAGKEMLLGFTLSFLLIALPAIVHRRRKNKT
ncbi:MAG: hypothetical protein GF308_02725 [Candidatus Heimdallarchaeota archaeon]|nr:hypothetical protein [Candidatus Heimdallarchaeota archaeon]